jgi:four helix bundle protein
MFLARMEDAGMATVTRFEELQVWQKARSMNKAVYEMTRSKGFARDFAMVDQFRRASISVMNNIAEGFDRYRRNEFLQFLSISKGSAGELRSMLYAALDAGYVDQPTFDAVMTQAQDLGATIGRLRTGLERSPPRAPARSGARRP